MLEKLITDVKKSLPGGARKAADAMEETQNLVKESAAISSAEEQKKKRMSTIIRVIVILGIGYYAVDEFLLKGDKSSEQTVDQMIAKAPTRKKRGSPKAEGEAGAEPAVAVGTETPSEAINTPSNSTVTSETKTTETPPIENVNILDKNVTATSPATEMPMETAPETPAIDTLPKVGESKKIDTSVDSKLDQLVDNVDPGTSTEIVKIPSQDTAQQSNAKAMDAMTSKISDNAVETAPPAYDQLGRGLVYNCKDKYWACVDKPAYVACNKNMKWNKSKGSPAECAVVDIYNSEEDCGKIQKYNVNINQSTAFCQN